jgi:hypothetical protein
MHVLLLLLRGELMLQLRNALQVCIVAAAMLANMRRE